MLRVRSALRLAPSPAPSDSRSGSRGAQSASATEPAETPDCSASCTKTLKTGERLVVGDRSAYGSVSAYGTATGRVRWVAKALPFASADRTFRNVHEVSGEAFGLPLSTPSTRTCSARTSGSSHQ